MNTLRTTHDWHFKPAVMLANALTAFILNLVSGGSHAGSNLLGTGAGELEPAQYGITDARTWKLSAAAPL